MTGIAPSANELPMAAAEEIRTHLRSLQMVWGRRFRKTNGSHLPFTRFSITLDHLIINVRPPKDPFNPYPEEWHLQIVAWDSHPVEVCELTWPTMNQPAQIKRLRAGSWYKTFMASKIPPIEW